MKKAKFDMVLLAKSKEADGGVNKFMEELRKELPAGGRKVKLGGFLKEKQRGKMIEEFEQQLGKIEHEWEEISTQIQDLITIKREEDFPIIKKSAKLAEYFYKLLVEEIEDIVDKGESRKHSEITKKVEKYLVDNKMKYEQELLVRPGFADLAYSPIIQSGGQYNLKPNAESNDDVLKYDCIMVSLGAKYLEYNTNVVRTLFIDASEDEKTAYTHV